MVNLNKTKSVKYKHTRCVLTARSALVSARGRSKPNLKLRSRRFYNEDIDWTLRVAAAGVRVCRFENIALARKVLEPIADEALLTDGQVFRIECFVFASLNFL